jgi:hypothetical protein
MINVHGHMTGPASTVFQTLTPPNGSLVGKCRLLLQIHDELVLEVEESALRDVARMVRHSMENVVKLAGMPASDGSFARRTGSSFFYYFCFRFLPLHLCLCLLNFHFFICSSKSISVTAILKVWHTRGLLCEAGR